MKELSIRDLTVNPMTVFGEEWFALAAGNEKDGGNVMTIAWGHMGTLWERDSHSNRLPTVCVYVRPSRYTKEIMDRENMFTLSLIEDRKALGYIGSHSGRDGDKFVAAGLSPAYENGTLYCKDAKMVLICRKLYQAPLREENFVDKRLIEFNYPLRDYHEMYIGEVIRILVWENN